jgi:pseudouridine synthase
MDRLQKLIANAGLCSRRVAEQWIQSGRVQVNGRLARTGDSADPTTDDIRVDGQPLPGISAPAYIALNKLAGYVTTRKDRHADHTIMELLDDCDATVYPVGRLDQDTTGLLLLTNDGEMAFRLTHPRFGIEKVYRAHVRGPVSAAAVEQLSSGVMLDDGLTAPARARLIGATGAKLGLETIELTLHEGRKRQVRRMLEAMGHRVVRLHRIRYGPIELGALRPGEWRNLSAQEVKALRKATQPE